MTWGDDRDTTLPPVARHADCSRPSSGSGPTGRRCRRAAPPAGLAAPARPRRRRPGPAPGRLPAGQPAARAARPDARQGRQPEAERRQPVRRSAVASGRPGQGARTCRSRSRRPSSRTSTTPTKLSEPAFAPQDSGIELSPSGGQSAPPRRHPDRPLRPHHHRHARCSRRRTRFFGYPGGLFNHCLGGNAVTRSDLSAGPDDAAPPLRRAVSVAAETYAVAQPVRQHRAGRRGRAFTSHAAALDHLTGRSPPTRASPARCTCSRSFEVVAREPAVATYSFLPWLRQGIANTIDRGRRRHVRATRARPARRAARSPATRSAAGTALSADLRPGRRALRAGRRGRHRRPRSWSAPSRATGSPTSSRTTCRSIEFYDEDFPWRYTPAAPSGDQLRLRPWIALVVLTEDEFAEAQDIAGRPLPYITVPDAERRSRRPTSCGRGRTCTSTERSPARPARSSRPTCPACRPRSRRCWPEPRPRLLPAAVPAPAADRHGLPRLRRADVRDRPAGRARPRPGRARRSRPRRPGRTTPSRPAAAQLPVLPTAGTSAPATHGDFEYLVRLLKPAAGGPAGRHPRHGRAGSRARTCPASPTASAACCGSAARCRCPTRTSTPTSWPSASGSRTGISRIPHPFQQRPGRVRQPARRLRRAGRRRRQRRLRPRRGRRGRPRPADHPAAVRAVARADPAAAHQPGRHARGQPAATGCTSSTSTRGSGSRPASAPTSCEATRRIHGRRLAADRRRAGREQPHPLRCTWPPRSPRAGSPPSYSRWRPRSPERAFALTAPVHARILGSRDDDRRAAAGEPGAAGADLGRAAPASTRPGARLMRSLPFTAAVRPATC